MTAFISTRQSKLCNGLEYIFANIKVQFGLTFMSEVDHFISTGPC